LIKPDYWRQAYNLCKDVDENDTPHIALTLELDGLLWTGDNKLKLGLQRQGFTRFFDG
jgi:predicted nucleic acid-binding protein